MAAKKNDADNIFYYEYNDKINDYIKLKSNATINSNIPILLVALIRCNAFYNTIRNSSSTKPIILEFKKLFNKINKKSATKIHNIDNIIDLIEETKAFKNMPATTKSTYHGLVTQNARVLNVILQMFDFSSFTKLFKLNRQRFGYCNTCNYEGKKKEYNLSIYKVHHNKYFDTYFDLEDNIYAERINDKRDRFVCDICNTEYKSSVEVTVHVPEILIIEWYIDNVEDNELYPKLPKALTIPSDDRMTYYYNLSSYLITDNEHSVNALITLENDGSRKYNTNVNSEAYDAKFYTKKITNSLLFYTKVGSMHNYNEGYL